MGSMKMSKILALGALEAEKLQKPRWPKYCGTPCRLTCGDFEKIEEENIFMPGMCFNMI